ncbi:hypothetical protein Q7P36_003582 [Cladosporium allicinum]
MDERDGRFQERDVKPRGLWVLHGVVGPAKIQRRHRQTRPCQYPNPSKAAAPPTRIPAALCSPCATYRWVTQRVHAEDVRRTSHEHLAVSQCYGIDLYAMCYASSKMPGRESETFEARAKATPGGVKPSRVSLKHFAPSCV